MKNYLLIVTQVTLTLVWLLASWQLWIAGRQEATYVVLALGIIYWCYRCYKFVTSRRAKQ